MLTKSPRNLSQKSSNRRLTVRLALIAAACGLLGCTGNAKRDLKQAMDPLFPPTPTEAAQMSVNIYDADQRRQGVTLLSAAKFGGEAPYLKLYRLLVNDEDASVRAACVKALGEHGTPQDVKLLIPRLNDTASFVRWEAAKALQKIHNPEAIPALIEAAGRDTDPDVRQASAQALGQYAEPRVFDTLVSALNDADFAVVEAAQGSLKTLTGYDFGTDGALWLIWRDKHRTDLFAKQQEYTYQPFVKPRGFTDKAQFWKKYERPEPRTPEGIEAAATQGG
jgi:HEAT repeat protein